MLNITNKHLSTTEYKVIQSDTTLYLTSDVDCSLIGVLKFAGKEQKILNFVKSGDTYQARLIITADDIKKLKTSKFYVIMISGSLAQQTNPIELDFDLELIQQSIKVAVSNEILELQKRIDILSNKLDSYTSTGVLKNINIQNKNYIEAGMIPVAIDNKGNFVAMYPFQDFINEVNGQKSANGSVVIDASMINYIHGKTIANQLDDQTEAIVKLGTTLNTLSEEIKSMRHDLGELSKQLESHITNGII